MSIHWASLVWNAYRMQLLSWSCRERRDTHHPAMLSQRDRVTKSWTGHKQKQPSIRRPSKIALDHADGWIPIPQRGRAYVIVSSSQYEFQRATYHGTVR